MSNVVGIRFKPVHKVYYFKPAGENLNIGDKVVAETIRGIQIGEVVIDSKEVDESELDSPLKDIKRRATKRDLRKAERNIEEADKAFDICLDKIAEHGLPMNLVGSEYTLDKGKLLFYFTADGRVDFRELVKDLASIFKTRIELRQIGVRDEAKMLGGLGPCGRELCCKTFLCDFDPISINLAKEQDLALNPNKISGICGRLMCCLKYEVKNYRKAKKEMPNIGQEVETDYGSGEVTDFNVVKETLKVDLGEEDEEMEVKVTNVEVTTKTNE
ncbi:MAG: PSP1 domain-containing protein [Bacillota bacterium]